MTAPFKLAAVVHPTFVALTAQSISTVWPATTRAPDSVDVQLRDGPGVLLPPHAVVPAELEADPVAVPVEPVPEPAVVPLFAAALLATVWVPPLPPPVDDPAETDPLDPALEASVPTPV